MEVSVFKLFSVGEAAENLEFGKRELEVRPTEAQPDLDGDVTSNVTNITAEGKDAQGIAYSSNINATSTIKAKWLSRDATRPYPGLIRRGETVLIWRVGDSDEYYWEEAGKDTQYRRGDMWMIACVSDVVKEGDHISPLNAYWFEIDSLNGVIRLSTTKANNELVSYLWEFMCKEGKFTLKDSNDNIFTLDSGGHFWKLANATGSMMEMNKETTTFTNPHDFIVNARNIEFNANENITMKAGKNIEGTAASAINLECVTYELKAQTSYTLNTTTASCNASANYSIAAPNIGLAGNISSTGVGGGAGTASFKANLSVEGSTDFVGNSNVTGILTNNGINVSKHNHLDSRNGTCSPMQ